MSCGSPPSAGNEAVSRHWIGLVQIPDAVYGYGPPCHGLVLWPGLSQFCKTPTLPRHPRRRRYNDHNLAGNIEEEQQCD